MSRKLAHRPDVDGLRAIAILALLGFVIAPQWIRGGHLGIDVFFVVSGYLLSASILVELEDGTFDLMDFYRRRLRRMLPALLLVLIAVLLIGWFSLFSGEYRQAGKSVAAGAAFVSNLMAWSRRDGGDASVLHCLWSVALLAQFCIAWPVVLKLSWPYGDRGAAAIAALLLLSFLAGLYGAYTHATAAFYSPPTRAWELMAGWILAEMQRRGWRWDEADANTAATLGTVLLLIGFAVVDPGQPFPGWRALLPVVGAALILSSGADSWLNRKFLATWPFVALGLISYPLYLWYWPAVSFATLLSSGLPSSHLRLALLVGALAAAVATHLAVEQPLRRRGRHTGDVGILVGMAFATAVLGSLCFGTHGFPGTGFRDPARQAFLDSYAGMTPAGCIERCTERDPAKRHRVLLWGDAQAQALYAGLKNNLPGDWQILQVTRAGCFAEVFLGASETGDRCEQWNRAALRTIEATRPDVVVVAQERGQFVRPFNIIATRLQDFGVARTLLVGPAPYWRTGLPTIVARHFWSDTPRRTFTGVLPQTLELNFILARNFLTSDIQAYVDVMSLFCDDQAGCLTYLGDDPRAGLTSMDEVKLTPLASDRIAREVLAHMIVGSVRD